MDKIKKYSNGLTLIVSEGGSLSCSFAIMIKTGSINETENNNGISHYIEHMNFKGTKNYNSFELSNIMDTCGASYNAYTSNDATCFYAQTIKDSLEKVFCVMSEAVFSSTYPEKEAKREKGVIIEEIYMSEDTPEDVCFDLSACSFFGDDGYGRTILGSKENVESFTKKDVKKYLNDYYLAKNTVITFAGNISFDVADSLVEKYVLPYIKGGEVALVPKHNTQNKKQFLCKNKDIEQVHFCLSFPSVSYVDDNKIKSEMAVSILGGGMSSRLFMKIREELGLAYSVYSYASRYQDVGTINIYAGVNSEKYQNAFEEILKTINDINKNGISDNEFIKVKNQIKASTVFSLEKTTAKVQLLSKYYLMTGKIYDYDDRINKVDLVTKKDVEEKMKEFNCFDMATAVVGKNVKPLKV